MAGGGRIIDDPRRWIKLQRVIAEANGSSVLVGVRGQSGWGEWSGEVPDDDPGIAVIAASNEFGTEDGRVPERSFLRSTLDEDEGRITRVAARAFADVVDGRAAVRLAMAKIGAFTVGRVQRKIRDLKTPGNAPLTIALKGFDNPLIHTGRLRQSIDYQVVEGGAESGVRAPRAPKRPRKGKA